MHIVDLTAVKMVEKEGLFAVQRVPGFRDHSLKGDRKGQRSVYLNKLWRLIYSTSKKGEISIVKVEEITPPMPTKKYGTKELEKERGPVTFARLLLTYRLTEEMTQDELGEKLGGLSRGVICDYEKGRRIPSPEKAARIAKFLGELEHYWVQTALQDYLRQHDLDYEVKLA